MTNVYISTEGDDWLNCIIPDVCSGTGVLLARGGRRAQTDSIC